MDKSVDSASENSVAKSPEDSTENPAKDSGVKVEVPGWTEDSKVRWSENARRSGEAAIARQATELNQVRWRSVALALGSSLLVLQFSGPEGHSTVPAALLMAASALTLVFILLPVSNFNFTLLPDALTRWMNGKSPAPNSEAAEEKIIEFLAEMYQKNSRSLKLIHWLYGLIIVLSAFSMLLAGLEAL